MRIKEIMSQPVVTCPADATLDHAARLMWEFDCGVVPVVGDEGRLVGIVTDRDVCMAAYTQGRPLSAIAVTTAMTTSVTVGRDDELVEHAETLMRQRRIRRLPVVDAERRPIGLVSLNDLARLADRARKPRVDRELIETLSAICQPHRPASLQSAGVGGSHLVG